MTRCSRTAFLAIIALILATATSFGKDPQPPVKPKDIAKPAPNSKDEPLADKVSLAKSAEFLDGIAVSWTREKKCGTCHTNYPYLMARPFLKEGASTGLDEVRKFFETRVANWDGKEKTDKPRWDAEVVATASTLAFNDAQTTGKLHPLTRKALDRMWTVQRADGSWAWLKCNWPPFEHDDYYGALLAAVGAAYAPDGYAAGDSAKEGLAKLRKFFQANPPRDLHHKIWLFWASLKLDGLMTPTEREATVKEIRARQRADGGWSLPSLGGWDGREKLNTDPNAPSDGYGTGFIVYVLRQSGVPATDEAVQRGVAWLKANQRASGRWFTRSLRQDSKNHYITHAGTGFAVMALRSCEQ